MIAADKAARRSGARMQIPPLKDQHDRESPEAEYGATLCLCKHGNARATASARDLLLDTHIDR
jgi:hypothetical protein